MVKYIIEPGNRNKGISALPAMYQAEENGNKIK
jgi:hypothetical protein